MNLKSSLKSIKLHESTISMVLGALVIVVAGVLLINYFSNRRGETVPPLEIEEEGAKATTHIVQEGEDLWKISEKYYRTGFEWSKIAEANNITDPNQITVGQSLIIPGTASAEIAQTQPTESLQKPKVEATLTLTEKPSPTPISTEKITPTSAQVEITKPGVTEHTVVKGENLWTIAEKYYQSGYNWVDISKENNLENPELIEEGQKLTIPSVESRLATIITEQDPESTSEAISGNSYTVRKGDSLWSIAVRAYGDGYRWTDIAKENNLDNPEVIHPGNVFKLPR